MLLKLQAELLLATSNRVPRPRSPLGLFRLVRTRQRTQRLKRLLARERAYRRQVVPKVGGAETSERDVEARVHLAPLLRSAFSVSFIIELTTSVTTSPLCLL